MTKRVPSGQQDLQHSGVLLTLDPGGNVTKGYYFCLCKMNYESVRMAVLETRRAKTRRICTCHEHSFGKKFVKKYCIFLGIALAQRPET